jgi:simple sugar transport system ATP-binding protein
MNIISVKGLVKNFDGVFALSEMDFCMHENEIRCLAGENGCGKSTLIKIISGFYQFDKGDVEIFEKKIDKNYAPEDAIHLGIQVIYQDFALFPNMTIAENIMMYETISGRRIHYNHTENLKKAREVLDRISFHIDANKYVYQLTVAEKQMVAICRALVANPKLLIMDEPTTALTKKEVDRLFDIVLSLKTQNVSILFVSHKLDEIYQICDCVTIMRNGKSVYESKKGEQLPSKEDIIYYMTGHHLTNNRYTFMNTSDQPLLEVEHYSKNEAFKDISFSLHRGEILGITGLLGCGRSELAEALFGMLVAEKGNIRIKGKDIGIISSVYQAIHESISYVPDDRLGKGLFLQQSIGDNALACTINELSTKLGVVNKEKAQKYKQDSFDQIVIPNLVINNPVKSLSGGNQQKVVLMKWLATKPEILILNCPTVGVDVGAKNEILSIVQSLAVNKGVGVIVISDDVYELLQVCNRIFIMSNGRITMETEVKDLSADKLEAMINGSDKGKAV